jgi:hypothetical protein
MKILIPLAIIALGILAFYVDDWRDDVQTSLDAIGAASITGTLATSEADRVDVAGLMTTDFSAVRSLTNSVTNVTNSRYDSYHHPAGTVYQVPAATTLHIGRVNGGPLTPQDTDVTVEIGYGDDAVSNSEAAPTNALRVFTATYKYDTGIPIFTPVFITVPAGKYPYMRLVIGNGSISAPWAIQMTGIEQ